MRPFGAILAGGESRRYGSPKALAPVGGRRIIDRVTDALGAVCEDLVLIANEPDLFRDTGLPSRPDARPGLGALGGIHAALAWAEEEDRPGIVAVACDMPFLASTLLARLSALAFTGDAPDLVVPESRGRRGLEPLCAAYRTSCLPALEARLDREDRRVIGFYDDVRVHRIPLAEVEALCDPDRAFLNVNTPDERDRAERIAEDASHGH